MGLPKERGPWATPTKMGRPGQEGRTNDRPKCRMESFNDGYREIVSYVFECIILMVNYKRRFTKIIVFISQVKKIRISYLLAASS